MNSSTPRTCRRAGAATVAWGSISNKPSGTGTPNPRSPSSTNAWTGAEKYEAAGPRRRSAGYQTRVGIARGPPVLGSVRAGSSTNVERTPTGWRPVGRGIDRPTPPEPADGAPRQVPAIVFTSRSRTAPGAAPAPTTVTSTHAKTVTRAV